MKSENHTGLAVKKLLAAALALSFFMLSADVYGKQKKGSTVIITLRDGWRASGELIAVKPASVLILDPAGKDASFDLREIAMVRVYKKAKPGKGAGVGLLVGVGIGYAFGAAISANDQENYPIASGMGLLGGGAGLIIGLLGGAVSGGPRDFELQGVSQESLKETLKTLKKYARHKEFK